MKMIFEEPVVEVVVINDVVTDEGPGVKPSGEF